MTATRSRAVCYTPTFSGGKAGNRYGGTAARAAPDAARDAHRGLRDPAARARRAGADPGQPAERPARARPGIGADAGQGARSSSRRRRRSSRCRAPTAGRAPSPSRTSRAACPPAPRPTACGATSALIAHQGTSGGFKIAALRRPRRPRVRLLRHRAALPAQRGQPQQPGHRRRRARHGRPGAPEADRPADRDPDAHAARVAEPQHGARPARGGQRQPGDLPGPGLALRRAPGLPRTRCCSSPSCWPASATRAGSPQDGRTFYATGTATQSITAIDVSNEQGPACRSGRATSGSTA